MRCTHLNTVRTVTDIPIVWTYGYTGWMMFGLQIQQQPCTSVQIERTLPHTMHHQSQDINAFQKQHGKMVRWRRHSHRHWILRKGYQDPSHAGHAHTWHRCKNFVPQVLDQKGFKCHIWRTSLHHEECRNIHQGSLRQWIIWSKDEYHTFTAKHPSCHKKGFTGSWLTHLAQAVRPPGEGSNKPLFIQKVAFHSSPSLIHMLL